MEKTANLKNGFTMIELLATILIIGVLLSIGIVSFFNFKNNQRNIFNNNQNKIFVEFAKTYIEDTPGLLPKKALESNYVTLKELRENNYITEDFLDYDHKKFSDDSKVTVTRIGNGIYLYRGHLVTSSGDSYDTEKAKAKFTYTYTNMKNNMNNKISKKHYTNNTPIIGLNVKSTNNVKIAAFMYTIYKNNILYKQSEVYYMKYTGNYDDSIMLNTNEYSDNTYRIKITVYDEYGYQISQNSEDIIIDTVKPKCSFTNVSNTNVLSSDSITMDLVCTDEYSLINNDTKNLKVSDFEIAGEHAVLTKISNPTSVSNGYKYKLTITGKTFGKFKVTLKSGSIKDNAMNPVGKISSPDIITYNKATVGSCNKLSYNGTSQTLASGGTGINYINNSGINAGNYTVVIKAQDGYIFQDNTIEKSLDCKIEKVNSNTTCINNLVYNGNNQIIATGSGCTLSNHVQVNAGSYNVSCTGDINHKDSNATCSIAKINSSVSCINNLFYNGNNQTIAAGNGCTLSNHIQVNAGSYNVSCTGDINHSDSSATCSIGKVNSSVSCVNGLTYNENNQTIATGNGCTLSNHIQKNAGSYNVSCTGDINHNDSNTTCSISKKNPTVTLSKSSLTFLSCESEKFTEKASVKGSFANSSSATSHATVSPGSYSNISKDTAKTVTVSGVKKGNATVTVKFTPSDTTNYNEVSKTVSVSVNKGTNSESSACGSCITAKSCTAAGCNKYSSWSSGKLVTYGPFASLTSCDKYEYTHTYEKISNCVISNSHDTGKSSCNCKKYTRTCTSPKQSLSICGCETYPTCCHSS